MKKAYGQYEGEIHVKPVAGRERHFLDHQIDGDVDNLKTVWNNPQ